MLAGGAGLPHGVPDQASSCPIGCAPTSGHGALFRQGHRTDDVRLRGESGSRISGSRGLLFTTADIRQAKLARPIDVRSVLKAPPERPERYPRIPGARKAG
jgi:hypothetical protein